METLKMFTLKGGSVRSFATVCLLLGLIVACSARTSSIRLSDVVQSEGDVVTGPELLLRSVAAPGTPGKNWGWDPIKRLQTFAPFRPSTTLKLCEEKYGIFPCSESVGGNLFLLLVYGFLMLKAAQFLSEGSELLLTVLNPGLIGGLLLPILGAFPDALLIVVSGLSGSAEEVNSEILVGMGLLAGSNVMLLTLLWGSSLIVGRCNLEPSPYGGKRAIDRTLTKGWSLTETGVTTDQQTRVSSWIMMVTLLPYLVAQSPRVLGWSKETGHIAVLAAGILSFFGLASYCAYQVTFPWIQERRIFSARKKVQRSHVLHRLSAFSREKDLGNLLLENGSPNIDALNKLVVLFDTNKDGKLQLAELKGLILGLAITHEGKVPDDDVVKEWMRELDLSGDGAMSKKEFGDGVVRWLCELNVKKRLRHPAQSNGDEANGPHIFLHDQHQRAQLDLTALTEGQDDDDDEEEESTKPTKGQTILYAVLYLIAGTLLAGVVADPMVDSIGNFSKVTGISPFFISFVATSIATTASESISSLLFALKKKKKNISMTYSQIYGGVTMNNTLCLGIFLAIVYFRGLTWDFSSEVLVVLIAIMVIGLMASVRVTFPLWMSFIGIAMYPLLIALVAVLDYVFLWR